MSNELKLAFPPSMSLNNLGVFGDSFNVLTSLFTGLAFAGVIISVILQTQELKESREEIREQRKIFQNQNFNESFYRLLDYHKNNLAELSIFSDIDNKRLKGIDALIFLLNRLKKTYASYNFVGFNQVDDDMKLEMTYTLFREVQTILTRQSRYLETIISILVLIDTQLKTDDEKKVYVNLLLSQLTMYELKYIFYQCLVSKDDDKLKIYVDKFKILFRTNPTISIISSHIDMYYYVHNIKLPKVKKALFHLPFDKKEIRKIKKRNRKKAKLEHKDNKTQEDEQV